jgi:hypothetical protein
MINDLFSKANHSQSKVLAWVLLIIFDALVIFFNGHNAPIFIVVPVLVFNLVIITVLFSAVEKKTVTSYIIQIEALILMLAGCNILGRISDWLAYLTVAIYLIFAYFFYRRTLKGK